MSSYLTIQKYGMSYYNDARKALKERGAIEGDNDGKYTADEFAKSLMRGVGAKTKSCIKSNMALFEKYAGHDGVFSTSEYIELINSKEYGAMLKEYKSLEGIEEPEIEEETEETEETPVCTEEKAIEKYGEEYYKEAQFALMEHALNEGNQDGKYDVDEFTNFLLKGANDEARELVNANQGLFKEYAGKDSIFNAAELTELLNSDEYGTFIEQYRSVND